jgi:hypothetical protein
LSDYEHLKDAVTVDNLTRDRADLNTTCKQLQGALEKAMLKAYEEKILRGTCEDKIQELKKTLEARELELDTLKGTFTHYVDSQATEKALKECNALLAQTSADLHSRSQELVDVRIRQNTLSAQNEQLEAANTHLKLLLQAAQDSIKVMQGASGLVEGVFVGESANSTTNLPSADAYVREREEQRRAKDRKKAEAEYTSHAMLIRPLQSQQRVAGSNFGANFGAPPRSSFDQSENASKKPQNTPQSGGWLVQQVQGEGGRESGAVVGGGLSGGIGGKETLSGVGAAVYPGLPSNAKHGNDEALQVAKAHVSSSSYDMHVSSSKDEALQVAKAHVSSSSYDMHVSSSKDEALQVAKAHVSSSSYDMHVSSSKDEALQVAKALLGLLAVKGNSDDAEQADAEGHRSKSPLRGEQQHPPPPTPSASTHTRVSATLEGGGMGVMPVLQGIPVVYVCLCVCVCVCVCVLLVIDSRAFFPFHITLDHRKIKNPTQFPGNAVD